MAKKKDPAIGVLNYFRTAEIGQATLVLGLSKEVVKERTGGSTAAKPAGQKRSKKDVAADTAPAGRLPNT